VEPHLAEHCQPTHAGSRSSPASRRPVVAESAAALLPKSSLSAVCHLTAVGGREVLLAIRAPLTWQVSQLVDRASDSESQRRAVASRKDSA
jgi:hypothetical protein